MAMSDSDWVGEKLRRLMVAMPPPSPVAVSPEKAHWGDSQLYSAPIFQNLSPVGAYRR